MEKLIDPSKFDPAIMRHLRICAGLTQTEAARVAGKSIPMYHKYEAGLFTPPPIVLKRLAGYYGVQVPIFFGLKTNKLSVAS